ncbi:MAG: ATP-binding protein, partial [Beijerinckiaceae bacterium]
FSPPGGSVRVQLRRARRRMGAVPAQECVEVIVDDDGPGIPEPALERIFERFYTDRPEEQGFGQNSGLGLSISRQIVEAHRGEIRARNRTDQATGKVQGARFTVWVPAIIGRSS